MEGLRPYADGNKLNGNSGYGATMVDTEKECIRETHGSKVLDATVFQAECWVIIEGAALVNPRSSELIAKQLSNP